MLRICEEYAELHNLRFSTYPDPAKCKTKCLAFLARPRLLPQIVICGNPLHWVSHGKHLGNSFQNKNGMKMDKKKKRAAYIDRKNTLFQEFYHAHPRTINEINRMYNNHFTGSPLWNLFCREAGMLCNSWNKSVRLMFDVPLSTRALRRNETVEINTNQEIFQLHFPNLKFSYDSS